jgi:hypothetical protein
VTTPRLRHNRYRGEGGFAGPHDSRHHAEDLHDFHLPLVSLQHADLHTSGVLRGFEVHGAPGATQLTVQAGVARDATGRLIVLGDTGRADIGADPDTGVHDEQPVPVALPLPAQTGWFCVTVRYNELLRANEGATGRLEQAPWLRVQEAAAVDGTAVVLAVVELAADPTQPDPRLRTLAARHDSVSAARRVVGRRLGELALASGDVGPDGVGDAAAGRISARAGGGLALSVATPNSTVTVAGEGGGRFARLEIQAGTTSAAGSLRVGTALSVGEVATPAAVGNAAIAGELAAGTLRATALRVGAVATSVEIPTWSGGGVLAHDVFATAAVYVGRTLSQTDNVAKLTILAETGDVQTQGSLTVAGKASIGELQVTNSMGVGPFSIGAAQGRVILTGTAAEMGFARRNLAAWAAIPQAGDRYVWYNQTGTAAMWTEQVGDLLRVNTDGDLSLRGSLSCFRVDQPLMFLYESGVANPDRPVVAHSPDYPDWGLFYRDPDDTFIFRSSGVPVMAVNLSGQMAAVGTDTAQVKFHVVGNRIRLQKPGTNQFLDLRADGAALDIESTGAELLLNNNNNVVRIRNLVATSSRDCKQNIADLSADEALTLLHGLNTVKFEFTDDDTRTTHVGFISEETPELVTSADKKAIRPFGVIALLAKVTRMQHEQISDLRAQLELLGDHLKRGAASSGRSGRPGPVHQL